MTAPRPFDAVLLISFGGPGARSEIRPFLANVLRGRHIPASRIEDVVHHYEQFDGVSPLTAITMHQAEGIRTRLASTGLPVFVGMRNWHPFLDDTLREMSESGVRRALGVTLAAQHCYSSCGQYKQNVEQARETLRETGHPDIDMTYLPGWHLHPGFVNANAAHISDARRQLPPDRRDAARLVFTAHSIPVTMAEESRYEAELRETAAAIADTLAWPDWTLVFQSRSGRPGDPWLEPDICDYLRAESKRGLKAVVVSPIGFVADHIEVLFDLDHEAAEVCNEIGIAMTRAPSVNEDPVFLDGLAGAIGETLDRYQRGRPLPIVPTTRPARVELPPPAR